MSKNISGIQQSKKVFVYDGYGNLQNVYPSLRKCAEKEKIAVTTLHYAIKNETPIGDYIYRYI